MNIVTKKPNQTDIILYRSGFKSMELNLQNTHGSIINRNEDRWRLQIPPGKSSHYRLAQLDDYSKLSRSHFRWNAPISLQLRARASASSHAGTWGFGLWNDPFGMMLGQGGIKRPLPALPNAAWFFFASPQNHLSFRNDKPPNGFLAAVFRSPRTLPLGLIPDLATLPLAIFKRWALRLRSRIARSIAEDSHTVDFDVTQFNNYRIKWEDETVDFEINGESIFRTNITPLSPLGIVIWIDNQFAAFTPTGNIKAGVLETTAPAWIEIEGLSVA